MRLPFDREPPARSRVKGLRSILVTLLRVHTSTTLYATKRPATIEERAACGYVADRLEDCITVLKALNLPHDPRETARVRKRPHSRTSR